MASVFTILSEGYEFEYKSYLKGRLISPEDIDDITHWCDILSEMQELNLAYGDPYNMEKFKSGNDPLQIPAEGSILWRPGKSVLKNLPFDGNNDKWWSNNCSILSRAWQSYMLKLNDEEWKVFVEKFPKDVDVLKSNHFLVIDSTFGE
ncbi:MAG: hypothetical protein IKN43_03850 [Selenomonadaceae bacterium]|nr:hypothetical protein [Selenomonadaceae bacterium]